MYVARDNRATRLDRRLADWVARQHTPAIDGLALVGSFIGTLPAVMAATLIAMTLCWYTRRGWRTQVVLLWALLGTEAIGLVLHVVFRHRPLETTDVWPYGVADLVTLRSAAVFGLIAAVVTHHNRFWGRVAGVLALLLILLTGFGVIWSQELWLTEVLLGYAAGGLILFAGIWWLEGHGPGLVTVPARSSNQESCNA
jgi:hypothetical protein